MDITSQQLLQGSSGGKKSTYIEDVFKIDLWNGVSDAAQLVGTGIDYTKGGMVWNKKRNGTSNHVVIDSENGPNKALFPNTNQNLNTITAGSAFTDNGFNWASENNFHGNGTDQVSWNFRKAPGFFDVVTWTGNGSNRTIAHNLGSVPGCIMVKKTTSADDWAVYHRGVNEGVDPEDYRLYLNDPSQALDQAAAWNDTAPTATEFSLGPDSGVNENTKTYVAYIFAGGESTAATAKSVDFDASGDYLNTTSSSSDFTMGTGDFTVECWVKKSDATQRGIFQISDTSGGLKASGWQDSIAVAMVNSNPSKWQIYSAGGYHEASSRYAGFSQGVWYHIAYVRNSGVTKLYVNGTAVISVNDTTNYDGTYISIGGYYDTSYLFKGHISNFRVVKGTAVYTSGFRPPTEPLANITGTVLLCCNDSSVTGSTVTPVTLNSQGNPTASTDSPFDDPEGYKFGDGGDQNIIKCGSLKTDASNGAILSLPWEPQYILYKHANANVNWVVLDTMRSWTADGGVEMLWPNLSNQESYTASGYEQLGSRTIKFQGYGNNYEFIYIAIRRPDGLVGKPAEAGTDVFAMDTGDGSGTTPTFDSGFPIGFALKRDVGSSGSWAAASRLTGTWFLQTNNTDVQSSTGDNSWDSNTGWNAGGTSNMQSWMWKRGQGFDVVTWTGRVTQGSSNMSHDLGRAPEMIWVKRRDAPAQGWYVYHKDLNSGNSPQSHYLELNEGAGEGGSSTMWDNKQPTETHAFFNGPVNTDGQLYLAYLFASVDGISKCGIWTGDGTSNNSLAITLGFSPRFVIIKRANDGGNWLVIDTLRGFTKYLRLQMNLAESTQTFITATATGFTLNSSDSDVNTTGYDYIYYAHA